MNHSKSHFPSGHRSSKNKWLPLAGFIFFVLVVVAGMLGCVVYLQAQQIETHESNAAQNLRELSNLEEVMDGKVSVDFKKVQADTQAADNISHNFLWRVSSHLPVLGKDIQTIQLFTATTDSLASDSIPRLTEVLKNLSTAKLDKGDGTIDLKPIVDSQKQMESINSDIQQTLKVYDSLSSRPGFYSRRFKFLNRKEIPELAASIQRLTDAVRIIPAFLGGNGIKNYAVMSMTTSEMRSSGGLIGSVGELTTENGTLHIGAFQSNADLLKYGAGDPRPDESAVFTTWGPLDMSFDVRDLAVFPDESRCAEAMRAIWQRMPEHAGRQLDGVIMLDPVFLQEIIAVNGDVRLPNGRVMTGKNTAGFLLNTIYKEYKPDQQDVLFGQVAESSINGLFHDMDIKKLGRIANVVGKCAKERHVSMYSFEPNLQKTIESTALSARAPDDEAHPSVGVYLTEQNPSKMGWYVRRKSKITRTSCNDDGTQKYHVTYTMVNTLPADRVALLPDYIVGFSQKGHAVEKVLVYPPAGGTISNLKAEGAAVDFREVSLNGKKSEAGVVDIPPGSTVTYSFDVMTSSKSVSDLDLDQTPMGWMGDGIERDYGLCKLPADR